MKDDRPDLRNMTVEDLFQAKTARRQRLANLPFEKKIEIVKRLKSVYPLTEVGFGNLVTDLLAPICLDLGIQISRVSVAMIPSYTRGEWLYDITQHVLTIQRWLDGRESIQGWEARSFKPRLVFGAELRSAIERLRNTNDDLSAISEAHWRQRLPISFLSFKAANGIWVAEWFNEPVLIENGEYVLFDIKFNRNAQQSNEKQLQIQIHVAALSEDSTQNVSLIRPAILALLESTEDFTRVQFHAENL
jgi:hypothetical protein